MRQRENLSKLAKAVADRSGIRTATVEVVLPALFDEIRQRLAEGVYPCVPIDSFGTFAVVDIPARRYHYYRPEKGIDRWVDLPATRRLKFGLAHSFKRELCLQQFDPSRKSFSRHPEDPAVKRRKQMKYRKGKAGVCKDGQFHIVNPLIPNP